MKYLIIKQGYIFLFTIFFSGCAIFKSIPEQQYPEELMIFLADFETAVIKHELHKLMDLMDKEYVELQHDDMLRGNTMQFVNEFFCGTLNKGDGFRCFNLYEIDYISRLELVQENENYRVSYEVFSNNIDIKTNWLITVKEKNGKVVYGLYGAMG